MRPKKGQTWKHRDGSRRHVKNVAHDTPYPGYYRVFWVDPNVTPPVPRSCLKGAWEKWAVQAEPET